MQKFFRFKTEKAAREYYWKHVDKAHLRSEHGCVVWVANHVEIVGRKVL